MWAPLREQLPYINMTVLDHANTAVVIFTPGVRSASSLPLPTKTPTGSSKDDAGGGNPRAVERLPRLLHPHCALHPQRHHRHHRRYLQARSARRRYRRRGRRFCRRSGWSKSAAAESGSSSRRCGSLSRLLSSAPHRSCDSVSLVLSLPMNRSRVVRWPVFCSPYSPTAPAFVCKIQSTSTISLLAKTSIPSGYGRCRHVFFLFYPWMQGRSHPIGSHDFFDDANKILIFFSVRHVSIFLPLDASSLRSDCFP
jgi:hypothetical protein